MNSVLYEKAEGGVAWVTLNRPEVLNAINLEMRDLLWEIMQAVRDDPEVRVVIFKGAGEKAFSAGADISEFGTAPSYVEARGARRQRDLWRLILTLEKPTVAAIHGFALGAGIELPMCCDIRIASDDARIGLPEVGLGYIPSAGGTQTVPRLIPPGVAMQMILTGEPIDAMAAHRFGLVNAVVPRAELHSAADSVARRMAAVEPELASAIKRTILAGEELSLDEAIAVESKVMEATILARAR